MKKVVVFGASVVDAIVKSKELKVTKIFGEGGSLAMCEMVGGKIEAESGTLVSGGGGSNVSVGLRRLGHSVKIVSRVGGDSQSSFILDELERENIDRDQMQKGVGETGLSVVLVSDSGGRSIVTYRGESAAIDKTKIDWEVLKKADWFQISSLGGDINFLEDLISFSEINGIRVGLNPGRQEIKQKEKLINLIPKVDVFNVNRFEASQLVGVDFENEEELLKAMIENKPKILALTDGKRGATILKDRRFIKMAALPGRSVDDTGAGDAFVSGLVAGILEERSLEDSLKLGLANGASCVGRLGAKAGLLYKSSKDEIISKKLKVIEGWV